MISYLLLIFVIILILWYVMKENKESYTNSNVRHEGDTYFYWNNKNKQLYQENINEIDRLQKPLIQYNICTKGYDSFFY